MVAGPPGTRSRGTAAQAAGVPAQPPRQLQQGGRQGGQGRAEGGEGGEGDFVADETEGGGLGGEALLEQKATTAATSLYPQPHKPETTQK